MNTNEEELRCMDLAKAKNYISDNPFRLEKEVEDAYLEMMSKTMQTKDISVLQHGLAVWDSFMEILLEEPKEDTVIPDWLRNSDIYKENKLSGKDLDKACIYAIFHDIGKTAPKITGDKKFPNHAENSYLMWQHFPKRNDVFAHTEIALMMKADMDLHTLSVEENLKRSVYFSDGDNFIRIVVAIAELNANAKMFGGYDSTSFKIKYKKTEKNCRRLFQKMFTKE